MIQGNFWSNRGVLPLKRGVGYIWAYFSPNTLNYAFNRDLPGDSVVKNPPANAGDVGSVLGLGRTPRDGNGIHDSCLGNPMDRGAWWATDHGVAKSQTRPSD